MAVLCVLTMGLVGARRAVGQDETVTVRIRTVRASDRVPSGGQVPADGPGRVAAAVAGPLARLAEKLRTLPYRSFSLVSDSSADVPVRRKLPLRIGQGQTVTVRPLSVDGDHVCLWLNWRDERGAEILDSRLHFKAGESLLAGTDHTTDTGLVLAIDVAPRRAVAPVAVSAGVP